MKTENENPTELVVQQALEESPGELSSKNPMVLSCGGIYIPYHKRRRMDRPLWEILNLADENNPVKLVTSDLPKSPLAEILEKENLN